MLIKWNLNLISVQSWTYLSVLAILVLNRIQDWAIYIIVMLTPNYYPHDPGIRASRLVGSGIRAKSTGDPLSIVFQNPRIPPFIAKVRNS